MLNSKISRAQQCHQLAVSCRLVLAHLGNCRWTAVPEVSEQGRNKLAIQLLTVTRARSPSTRVALGGLLGRRGDGVRTLFAEQESACGTKRRLENVRFCAACGA